MSEADAGPAPEHAGFGAEMRVDWLMPGELVPALPGRLGMTFLPGKHGASSRYPGHTYRRDLRTDLAALRTAGVRRLVLLVEDAELARWSDPRIEAVGADAGVRVDRFPIPDGAAPSLELMDRIQEAIDEGRRVGDVAVACMGGVGRTGTVAACSLVRAGQPAARAIARVRAVRHPGAVETAEQEQLVRAWELSREAAAGGPA